MKVLVACEFSGRVRDAFIRKGHDAISCDLLPTESPGPHIQGDVLEFIKHNKFDLMIGHPPCTYLSRAANSVWNTPGRQEKRENALQFFKDLYYSKIEKICLENPLGYVSEVFMPYTQIIHPYYFGTCEMKRTCLWLKNLPPLIHCAEDELFYRKTHTEKPQPYDIQKTGKRKGKRKYFMDRVKAGGGGLEGQRHRRSVTFQGIADAMADQWG